MSMKNLKKLCEAAAGVEFSEFPGPMSKNIYYPQKKAYSHSRRFWLIFKRHLNKDKAIFGDFKFGKTHTFSVEKLPQNVEFTKSVPKGDDYAKDRLRFTSRCLSVCQVKGHNAYSEFYKNIAPRTFLWRDTLLLPFVSKHNHIEAMLQISAKGDKRWVKDSEPSETFFLMKKPAKSDHILYLCEGLNTGYAILSGMPESAGVACVGSLSNLEKVVRIIKTLNYQICLAGEKSGWSEYLKIKHKYKCFMVGDPYYDDLDHFYRKTNTFLLKKLLISFNEKRYVPLGISESNRIVSYSKTLNVVREYSPNDALAFYSDMNNVSESPPRQIASDFYWENRHTCRQLGPVKKIRKIREGIFEKGGSYYFYDMQNLYLLKENQTVKVSPTPLITPDFILCRENVRKYPELDTLQILTPDELRECFSYINLFNFSDLEKKLLLGWVIQAVLCGGLPYRPPIWIVGSSGVGKSHLTQKYLCKFFAHYHHKIGRTTSPVWLPREFNGRAIPLHRDEYEPSQRHKANTRDEMEFIRAAVTSRYPERGISAGMGEDTLIFIYCLTVIFSSCKAPKELTQADRNRLIFFELQKSFNKSYFKLINQFNKKMTLLMQYRFLKTCFIKLPEIVKQYTSLMQAPEFSHIRSHKKSSYFILMACYNLIAPDNPMELSKVFELIKPYSHTFRSRILTEVLSLVLKKTNYQLVENVQFLHLFEKKHFTKLVNSHGVYIYRNNLLIHERRGVSWIKRLFNENGQDIDTEDLHERLRADGEFFIKTLQVGKVIASDAPPRGKYLTFNWIKIQRTML